MIKLKTKDGYQWINVFKVQKVEVYEKNVYVHLVNISVTSTESIDHIVAKIEDALIKMAGGHNVQTVNQ